jgi:nucleotide-binding universal stress UspA family protein
VSKDHRHGFASPEILTMASLGAGRTAAAGMLLGSVSEHLAAHAPCPVVVIRHIDRVEQAT